MFHPHITPPATLSDPPPVETPALEPFDEEEIDDLFDRLAHSGDDEEGGEPS
jgi:hypothetical protein